jgi:GNAT superfamily N-acetyltransferase
MVIRPMRASDGTAMRAGFLSLSPASLQQRFFSPIQQVPVELLDQLTVVDPATRLVLLAFDGPQLLGGARAMRLDAATADLAVTVGDAHQGRGVGSALLAELRTAAAAWGVDRLIGHVRMDNEPAKRMLRRAGARLTFDEPGVLRFELGVGLRHGEDRLPRAG